VLLLIWFFTFDLFGKREPTNNYASAGITLRIRNLQTPPPDRYVQQGRSTLQINLLLLILLSPPVWFNKIANCLNFSSCDFLAFINIYKPPRHITTASENSSIWKLKMGFKLCKKTDIIYESNKYRSICSSTSIPTLIPRMRGFFYGSHISFIVSSRRNWIGWQKDVFSLSHLE